MRIVFIGAVEFSRAALQCLVDINSSVVGVCTLKSSKLNADHADLSEVCRVNDVPSLYATDINSIDTLEWIQNKKPDIIFCFGWSKLLKEELLKLTPLGVVGFHPAALPANRGRHPLIWALVLGLKRTASTSFFMETGADNGDILDQREVNIDEADDAGNLPESVIPNDCM